MSESRIEEDLSRLGQAATDALAFVSGLSKGDFLHDKRTQQAVVMSLLILGETAGKLMDREPAHTETHPEIPWRPMRGMRDRIAHGSFDLDLDVVWETTQTALPELPRLLQTRGRKPPDALHRVDGTLVNSNFG